MEPRADLGLDPATLAAQTSWVRRLAHSLVDDAGAAEDVAQDALIAALRRGPEAFERRAWLAGVVRKLALKLRRGDARRRAREQLAARAEREPSSAELVERVALARRLADAVLELEEPYRTTVLLRFVEDLPPRRIAARQGVSVGTVKTRLARALGKLRERLGSERNGRCASIGALASFGSGQRGAWLAAVEVLLVKMQFKLGVAVCAVLAALWLLFRVDWSAPATDAAVATTRDSQLADLRASDDPSTRTTLETQAAVAGATQESADSRLRGIVVDDAGAPIAAAEVELRAAKTRPKTLGALRSESGEGRALAGTRTAADGRFALSLERWRSFDVRVRAAGYTTARRTDVHEGEDLRIELARVCVLEGRVTNAVDGTPVVAARVGLKRAVLGGPGVFYWSAATDEHGAFRFDDAAPGFARVEVGVDARAWRSEDRTLAPGAVTRADFVLPPPGAVLRGRVVDAADQRPIADARVSSSWMFEPSVRTDAAGCFALEVDDAVRNHELYADADGYASTERVVHGSESPLEFALERGRTAIGVVVDPQGKPVGGARVSASSSVFRNGVQLSDHRDAISDDQGRFRVTCLRPDQRHTFEIGAEGLGLAVGDFPVSEFEVDTVDLGLIALHRAARVSGRVLDGTGRPLADSLVELTLEPQRSSADLPDDVEAPDWAWEGKKSAVMTDSLGRFEFVDLPPGNASLRAGRKASLNVATAAFTIAEGDKRDGVELVFDLGATIGGRVVDDQGRAVPGASVDLYTGLDLAHHVSYDLAREDGSFLFGGLEASEYALAVNPLFASTSQRRLMLPAPLRVRSGDDGVRVVLRHGEAITGRVLDADGRPVYRCGVSIVDDPDAWHGTDTDREGRFELLVATGAVVDLDARAFLDEQGALDPARVDDSGRIDPGFMTRALGVRAGAKDVVIRLGKPLPVR